MLSTQVHDSSLGPASVTAYVKNLGNIVDPKSCDAWPPPLLPFDSNACRPEPRVSVPTARLSPNQPRAIGPRFEEHLGPGRRLHSWPFPSFALPQIPSPREATGAFLAVRAQLRPAIHHHRQHRPPTPTSHAHEISVPAAEDEESG